MQRTLDPIKDQKIAIIGAGISGLRCANLLLEQGATCALFDKSRGFGGRTSTRRKDNWRFDHGTGYFSGTDPDFLDQIKTLQPWHPTGAQPQEQFYVGVTGNNELAKNIAAAITAHSPDTLSTHLGTTITRVTPAKTEGWQLSSNEGETFGPFDLVISTAPPPQAVNILADIKSSVTKSLSNLHTYCTWALMLVTEKKLKALDLEHAPSKAIARIVAEHSKPHRQTLGQGQYVVQASLTFSQTHIEATPEEITQHMLAELHVLYGPLPEVVHSQAHRWLHAGIQAPLGKAYLLDRSQGIAAAGDWCTGTRAEDAFISGSNLARAIIEDG